MSTKTLKRKKSVSFNISMNEYIDERQKEVKPEHHRHRGCAANAKQSRRIFPPPHSTQTHPGLGGAPYRQRTLSHGTWPPLILPILLLEWSERRAGHWCEGVKSCHVHSACLQWFDCRSEVVSKEFGRGCVLDFSMSSCLCEGSRHAPPAPSPCFASCGFHWNALES